MYRILVVEDDEVIAKTIRQHLQSWNYEVFAVADFNSVMEEFARVKPHLAGESHMLEHQGVWLNLSDGTLTYEEQILELSKNERKILQTLLENPGAIVTRENLMMALWESDVYVDENTLSVNVNRLRRKLETIGLTNFILTRKGIGYQIKK